MQYWLITASLAAVSALLWLLTWREVGKSRLRHRPRRVLRLGTLVSMAALASTLALVAAALPYLTRSALKPAVSVETLAAEFPHSSATTANLRFHQSAVDKARSALANHEFEKMMEVIHDNSSAALYNVLFSPAGAAPGILPDQQSVQVKFYIGPPAPDNAVPVDQQPVSPDILGFKQDVSLLVTLSCLFCKGPSLEKQVMVFSPGKQSSTPAVFLIVPDRTKTKEESGKGQLVFQVTNNGILYDNVIVPVTIGGQTSEQHVRSEVVPGNMARPPGSRDVDLTITCLADEHNNVIIELDPADPALAASFLGRHLAPDRTPAIFQTGMNAADLSQLVASYYANLVSVVEHNPSLQRALNGDPANLQMLVSSNTVLGSEDEALLLNAFYRSGRDLYRRLFLQDRTLRDLAAKLDAYASSRPLRIRIETQRVYVPWQILHPLTSLNVHKFWGFRYELIVDPQGNQGPGYYPGAMRYSTGPLIFAKYRADKTDSPGDQDVAELGDAQINFLISSLKLNGVMKADSRDAFLKDITASTDTVQMIVAYTHADNGTILKEINPGQFTPMVDVAGAKLRFSKDEFVTAQQLDELPSNLLIPMLVLKQHPIVFLNGCETAGGGYFATVSLNFPAIFLRFGARGVIATEAPVWDMFGYYFGTSLLRKLRNNEPASLAILDARNELLGNSKNPLGLLYSYYGGVDATINLQ